MNQQLDDDRRDRDINAKIERLRARVKTLRFMVRDENTLTILALLLGILDLLGDEL